MKIPSLLLAASCFTKAFADSEPYILSPEYTVFTGCAKCVFKTVIYSNAYMDYSQFCLDKNALSTLLGCYNDVNKNSSDFLQFIIDQCETNYGLELNQVNITEGYNNLAQNGVSLQEFEKTHYSMSYDPPTYPVFVNSTLAKAFIEGEKRYDKKLTDSTYFGIAAVSYWIFVCLVGALFNWTMIIFPKPTLLSNSRFVTFCKKNVILPALVCKKRSRQQNFGLFSFLIPSRLETIVCSIYMFLLIGFCASVVSDHHNNPVFNSDENTLLKYIADRCGTVCIFTIPLLLLFGGRNNFLIWFTRWKFSTFITFHRWIGRTVVLLALVHGCCYSSVFTLAKDYSEAIAETFITWGLVALTCGCLICFEGLLFIRRRWYETFLVIHILLAMFFVIAAWFHVSVNGYQNVLYACFAVWGTDRLVRVVRVLVFGFPQSEVRLIEEKLEVRIPKPAHWNPVPGGCAWLYFGDKFWFWQSHPFCYIWDEDTVTFYCKVQSGITLKLRNRLEQSVDSVLPIRVAVEGPYGHAHPIRHHSDVVFVAGGNGFPGIFSEFKSMLHALGSKQRVKFNWIVKDSNSFELMSKHFKELSNSFAEINVFFTRSQTNMKDPSDIDENEKCESASSDSFIEFLRNHPEINFQTGRPDLEHLVQTEITEAGNSVAFVCCGPAVMVDDMRSLIVKEIDHTAKRVDFFDTLEVWA